MFGTNEIVGKKYFKDAPAGSLFVTSMFFTLQGEGPYAGMPALFIRLTKCNLACSFCFVPTTKVTMANGLTKRIDQVEVGDEVMSWSGDRFEAKKVTRTYTSIAEKIVKVTSSGEPVWCTPEHPFLTSNRGWINAEDLVEGDKIVHWTLSERRRVFNPMFDPANYTPMSQEQKNLNSARLKLSEQYKIREKVASFINNGKVVKKVEFVNKNDGRGWARLFGTKTAERKVYNLEIEDNHTYIANGCVVHNCDTFFDDGDWMTFDEINVKATNIIRNYWLNRSLPIPKWIDSYTMNGIGQFREIILVVTGGEPLLQKNLMDYLNYSKSMFGNMQIESNGLIDQDIPEHVTLVCSPKCAEKEGKATKYLGPTNLILERADCLKFVMSADQTSPYSNIPDWAHEWKNKNPGKEIYISPMNIYNTLPQKIKLLHSENGSITMDQRSTVDEKINFFEPGLLNMDEIAKNHEYVGKYCMDYGFRMNMQMHLFANLA